MLQKVRGAMSTIVAAVLAILFVPAFALWGVPELRQFTRTAPLVVDGVAVTPSEIRNEFDREIRINRGKDGKVMTQGEAVAAGLDKQVLERLTVFTLLDQDASRMGLSTPRTAVADFVKDDDTFKDQNTGKFDRQRYASLLEQNGLTEAKFETLIRGELTRSLILDSIQQGASFPKAMERLIIQASVEKRQIAYVVVTPDIAGKAAAPTPQALETYYQQHRNLFRTPEYRTFTTVLLKTDDFAARAKISEEDLRKAYDAVKEQLFVTPERRTFYQIRFDKEADAAAALKALGAGASIEKIAGERGVALKDATFTDAAKGDVVDPKVADAVFAADLKAGVPVGPIKGLFGATIVQLVSVTPGSTKPFEEARAQIQSELGKAQARKLLTDAVEKLEEARDTGDGLAAAAKKAGLEAQTFGPIDDKSFAPGGAIVAGVPGEVLKEAFKLDEGGESQPLELADNAGYFLVAVDAVQEQAFRPYKDVTTEVERRWRDDEALRRMETVARKIRAEVLAGKSLDQAAAPLNRAPLLKEIDRGSSDDVFSEDLRTSLFKLGKGGATTAPVAIGQGVVVAQVQNIGFDFSRVNPEELQQFSAALRQRSGEELTQAYIDTLLKDRKVTRNEAALAGLFGQGAE